MTLSMQQRLASTVPVMRSPAMASALDFLRRHPLASYFVLAYTAMWAWLIPMYVIAHQQILGRLQLAHVQWLPRVRRRGPSRALL